MDDTVIALMKRSISEYKDGRNRTVLGRGPSTNLWRYSRLVGRYEALKLLEADLVKK